MAVVGCVLMYGLAACSSNGHGAAAEIAGAYVEAIANGSAREVDELASYTATPQPAAIDAAGRMLLGAEERIEIVDVGDVHDADRLVSSDDEFDALDSDAALATTVRYRLNGSEHEGDIVLAPLRGEDRDDPETWVVVAPLTGTMTLVPDANDRLVGGVRVYIGDPALRTHVPIYPGTYDFSRQRDPYLTSTPVSRTVLAGAEFAEPDIEMEGTADAEAALADDLRQTLDACPTPRCPDGVRKLVDLDISSGDWDLDVSGGPDMTLDGNSFQFTELALTIDAPDGSTSSTVVDGTGTWRIANPNQPIVTSVDFSPRSGDSGD